MKYIAAIAKAIRDTWLIIGIALALVVGSETFYRLLLEDEQPAADLANPKAITLATRGPKRGPPHPYQEATWYAPWLEARRRAYINGDVTYDPYRGWWPRGVTHAGLNVNAAGIRRTVQPALAGKPRKRSVYLFGGSTIWGFTARDHATIPSLLAARLAEAGDGWTLQLGVYCDAQYVSSEVERFGRQSSFHVLPILLDGQACFRLCWGSYPSHDAAKRARDLPSALRSSGAFPQKSSTVLR